MVPCLSGFVRAVEAIELSLAEVLVPGQLAISMIVEDGEMLSYLLAVPRYPQQ